MRLDGITEVLHVLDDAFGELEAVHEDADVGGVGDWREEKKAAMVSGLREWSTDERREGTNGTQDRRRDRRTRSPT